jgi:hypothetical protein
MNRLALKDATVALHHATGGRLSCDWRVASIVDRRNGTTLLREHFVPTPRTVLAQQPACDVDPDLHSMGPPEPILSLEVSVNPNPRVILLNKGQAHDERGISRSSTVCKGSTFPPRPASSLGANGIQRGAS